MTDENQNFEARLLTPNDYKAFATVYNDFVNRAVTEYNFDLDPLDFEGFIDAVEKKLIDCVVLFENAIPVAFLVYTTAISEAIELNIIHSFKMENMVERAMYLLKKFLELTKAERLDKIVCYPMLGSQKDLIGDIARYGFKFVGIAVLRFMTLLNAIHNAFPEQTNSSHLQLLDNNSLTQTKEEIVYRKNGKSIDRIMEVDAVTGLRLRTTHFDYFNDKKVRSIDEYDKFTGKKIRTINYVLYKSVDEYDLETGKKIRTINFNIKDENKISSIQEYDLETEKIVKISIFKRDGKTISIIKSIDPVTEKVTSWINNQYTDCQKQKHTKAVSRIYENIKTSSTQAKKDDVARLIDNLYSNKLKFDVLRT